MSAHVALLLEQFLQIQFHREVSERITVDHEHGLDENDFFGLVHVELAAHFYFFLLLRHLLYIDSNSNRRLVFTGVIELEINLEVRIFRLLLRLIFLLFVKDDIRVIRFGVTGIDFKVVHANRLRVLG